MKKVNKVTVGLFFCVVAMMSSCVQGDLYELYEEDELSATINAKRTKQNSDFGPWSTKECALFSLFNLAGDTNYDDPRKRDKFMKFLSEAKSPGCTSRGNWYETVYQPAIETGGFNEYDLGRAVRLACNNRQLNTISIGNSDFWSNLGGNPDSTFEINGVKIIHFYRTDGTHFGVLSHYKPQHEEKGIFGKPKMVKAAFYFHDYHHQSNCDKVNIEDLSSGCNVLF